MTVPGESGAVGTDSGLHGWSSCRGMVFGERSTGAVSDIEQAAEIARKIVFAGRSDLGVVTSELPSGVLVRTITQIIKEQETQVYDYLAENQGKLHVLAQKLLEQERLSGVQFRQIMQKSA